MRNSRWVLDGIGKLDLYQKKKKVTGTFWRECKTEHSGAAPPKVKHRLSPRLSHSLPRDIPERVESRPSDKHLHEKSSAIHNC